MGLNESNEYEFHEPVLIPDLKDVIDIVKYPLNSQLKDHLKLANRILSEFA